MGNRPVLSLQGYLHTDYSGVKRLFDFYHSASEYTNTTLYLDFYHLDWIDANLCALLQSMLYKLHHENNVNFSADLNFINDKFSILFRNGFITNGDEVIDDRKSSIVLTSFSSKNKDGFIKYVSEDLLEHRGMPIFTGTTKDDIVSSLIEVFNNIDIHAKTEYPLFVCGQYYPKKEKIIFSIVDLGVGFLPAIESKTNGEINNNFDAILWSLEKGNTTKINKPGGLGLNDLYTYFKKEKGDLQIITGDTYWSMELENTLIKKFHFKTPFTGSIINLHFSCN
jgi:hypothetical protein